jgi:hypothetical protein
VLTQFSVALWQLVELGFVLKPTWRRAVAVVAIGLINASLHLSTLVAVAALPLLWLVYRGKGRWRTVLRGVKLFAVPICGIVPVWLLRHL